MSPDRFFGNLVISRYCFTLVFDPDADLPEFPSISMRGLLGWMLQEFICPFLGRKKPACIRCRINELCPYFILYEQKVRVSGITEAPRPYILFSRKSEDIHTELFLTLFGKCHEFMPQIAAAMVSGGGRGMGKNRYAFKVTRIREITPEKTFDITDLKNGYSNRPNPPTLSQWLDGKNKPVHKVRFESPVRLRRKGKYLSEMDWPFYFSSLARRLESLNFLYGDGSRFGKENWLMLCDRFSSWKNPSGRLSWHDIYRYSNRQGKKVPLGGLWGKVSCENGTEDQYAWWRTASLVHVGKGAVMGMGKIEIS